MKYTKQKNLGRFGARWGCYATCLINIAEREMERKLSHNEMLTTLGAMFLGEQVALANYKSHKSLGNEMPGWSERADPEWHFLIRHQEKALADILAVFGMSLEGLTHMYEIHRLKTPENSHFVLVVDGEEKINPDPSINGPVTEVRKVA